MSETIEQELRDYVPYHEIMHRAADEIARLRRLVEVTGREVDAWRRMHKINARVALDGYDLHGEAASAWEFCQRAQAATDAARGGKQ